MLHPRRIASPILVTLVLALPSCAKEDGFNVSSRQAFASSCMDKAYEVTERMNAVASTGRRADPPSVAAMFAAFTDPPPQLFLPRDFDPNVPIPIAGADLAGQPDATKSCAMAAERFERYGDVTPVEALRLGLNNLLVVVNAQIKQVRDLRRDIESRQVTAKAEALRLRIAMDRYAPKGVTFRVSNQDGRYVPSVEIDAANVVERPITAFILTIRLVGADGTPIGGGRVRFVPPVPLGPGVESTYVLNLAGVRGLDTRTVVTYSGAVRIFVTLDDLFIEGKPILGALVVGPIEKARTDAIQVLINAMQRYQESIRSFRARQISAFG